MTECTTDGLLFSSLAPRKKVVADFDGGELVTDAGVLLLREVDLRLRLTERFAACLVDPRDPAKIIHDLQTMAAQRLFALACAYEDLNDHQALERKTGLVRLLAAYTLLQTLRRTALAGTELAKAQVWTIRLKLLKIAARVKVSVRRVVISLASSHPSLALFRLVAERLRGRRLTPE